MNGTIEKLKHLMTLNFEGILTFCFIQISVHQILNCFAFFFFPPPLLQSISAPGSGIWSDGKDKNDGSQVHTWNVEVLIDVVKEVVSELLFLQFSVTFPF